jgi:hypothetical protein
VNAKNLKRVMEKRGWIAQGGAHKYNADHWYAHYGSVANRGIALWMKGGAWEATVYGSHAKKDVMLNGAPTLRAALDWINSQLVALKLKGDV